MRQNKLGKRQRESIIFFGQLRFRANEKIVKNVETRIGSR